MQVGKRKKRQMEIEKGWHRGVRTLQRRREGKKMTEKMPEKQEMRR